VLLAVLAVSRAAVLLTAGSVEIIMRFNMSGLVRRNLLRSLSLDDLSLALEATVT